MDKKTIKLHLLMLRNLLNIVFLLLILWRSITMMTKEKEKLQNDITNFILNDKITRVHRENILNDILEDYFEGLDDDMIEAIDDFMFPIMEKLNNDN